MSQAGASANLGHSTDPDSGELRLDISERPGAPPVSGGGTLAILEFVPTARGDSTVSIAQAFVRDANNEGVASVIGPKSAAITIRD